MNRCLWLLVFFICSLTAEQKNDIALNILKPANMCTFCQEERPGPVNIKGSFLIWQSKLWGLEFISKSFISSDPHSSSQTFRQKLSVPDFSWSPGFKIDFGFILPKDNWDVDSRWTCYRGDFTSLKKHFHSVIAPTGIGIVPLWHYPFINISADSDPLRFMNAASNWKMFFNSFDLNIGRIFTPRKSMIFRMHLGAKGSWIRQHYHVEYINGTTVSATIRTPPAQSIRYLESWMGYSSYSYGVGPRGGIDSKWNFGYGFSLVGNCAVSILESFLHLSTEFSDRLHNLTTDENLNNDLHLKRRMSELIPVFEGTIGVDWGTCFKNKKQPVYVGITLAYEVQYWWSQNHTARNYAFQSPGNMWDMRGDLQMHGLTASLRLDI